MARCTTGLANRTLERWVHMCLRSFVGVAIARRELAMEALERRGVGYRLIAHAVIVRHCLHTYAPESHP